MTSIVKKFIEENIEAIDREDWYGIFFSWYLHWAPSDRKTDEIYIRELLQILQSSFF